MTTTPHPLASDEIACVERAAALARQAYRQSLALRCSAEAWIDYCDTLDTDLDALLEALS